MLHINVTWEIFQNPDAQATDQSDYLQSGVQALVSSLFVLLCCVVFNFLGDSIDSQV